VTKRPIIAIDGPAAAGKGTLARRLASSLDLPYMDTGLLYRAVGRIVLNNGGNPADPVVAEKIARTLMPSDLERDDLRGPEADAAAVAVASVPGVRTALLDFQRNFAGQSGAVLDGRDIGTVIFPDASAKLFVTASLKERARRRWLELDRKGVHVQLETVEHDLMQRDRIDADRATAPLRAADDAYLLDTTEMDADTAFEAALAVVRQRI
jgi:cytidylate kinase